MSFNNVILAELLLGVVHLKSASDVENPAITIPNELVCDVLVKYEWEGLYGSTSSVDHPAFATVRKMLSAQGFIEIPGYPCVNGDIGTKRFRFNDFQLEVGDKFYCASAWSNMIKLRDKKQ